ncbi:hypothetical protein LXL04_034381 [Taraxacum kok-saghyz]
MDPSRTLVGPALDLGDVVGHARTSAERHLVEHLACDQNDPDLQTQFPASFLHRFQRGLFLSARNHEGFKSPKSISRKRSSILTDLKRAAVRGGCAASDPFSGVVRSNSWSGFGRGRQRERVVCSDPKEMAGFVGFEGGCVSRPSATVTPIWAVSGGVLRTETCVVVSWMYGEDVVKVWERSEVVCVFPATPAAAARWLPAAAVVAGGGSRVCRGDVDRLDVSLSPGWCNACKSTNGVLRPITGCTRVYLKDCFRLLELSSQLDDAPVSEEGLGLQFVKCLYEHGLGFPATPCTKPRVSPIRSLAIIRCYSGSHSFSNQCFEGFSVENWCFDTSVDLDKDWCELNVSWGVLGVKFLDCSSLKWLCNERLSENFSTCYFVQCFGTKHLQRNLSSSQVEFVRTLVGPALDLGDVVGHARTSAERHLVEHLACDQNDPDLQTQFPASFLHRFQRGLFLSARNHEGFKSPKSISRKRSSILTDLKRAAVRGGCAASDPFSGVVRSNSWSGFGRGRQRERVVCSDPKEMAGFVGFEGGGVSRPSATVTPIWAVSGGVLRTETCVVVSWMYGEDVVKVWERSEVVCVFPATPAAAARWLPAAAVVAGGGSRACRGDVDRLDVSLSPGWCNACKSTNGVLRPITGCTRVYLKDCFRLLELSSQLDDAPVSEEGLGLQFVKCLYEHGLGFPATPCTKPRVSPIRSLAIIRCYSGSHSFSNQCFEGFSVENWCFDTSVDLDKDWCELNVSWGVLGVKFLDCSSLKWLCNERLSENFSTCYFVQCFGTKHLQRNLSSSQVEFVRTLVGPALDLGDVVGHARTSAERHLVEHLACDQNDPDLQTQFPASFLHRFQRGLFLSARNHEGFKSPKSISRKRSSILTDLKRAAVRGGCAASDPFSGVVRSNSWSGFGRGRQRERVVCSDPKEMAGFIGFEGGGVSRPSATVTPIWAVSGGVLRTETCVVVSWMYGEDVVKVWERSEVVCVFPATPAAAARWLPAAAVVAGGGSR